jgi:hypothetical protein
MCDVKLGKLYSVSGLWQNVANPRKCSKSFIIATLMGTNQKVGGSTPLGRAILACIEIRALTSGKNMEGRAAQRGADRGTNDDVT